MEKIYVITTIKDINERFISSIKDKKIFDMTVSFSRLNTEIEKIKKLDPKIILLDIDMLKSKNDIDEKLFLTLKTSINKPIIILSSNNIENSKFTIRLLELGAIDVIIVDKIEDRNIEKSIQKITFAIDAKISDFKAIEKPKIISEKNIFKKKTQEKILIIGASTGGPQSLELIIKNIPKDFPLPILIVQHMPENFTSSFAKRLNELSYIDIKEAEDNEEIKKGTAYIAKGNYHMELCLIDNKKIIRYNQKDRELGVRPNINIMFKSVAKIYKDKVIGIILTGMGRDGTEGCKEIKKYQGTVIVQSKESSIIFGMPKSVIESDYYDEIIDLDKMLIAILQLVEI